MKRALSISFAIGLLSLASCADGNYSDADNSKGVSVDTGDTYILSAREFADKATLAHQGDADAAFRLSNHYANWPPKADQELADIWLKRAALRGHRSAIQFYIVGRLSDDPAKCREAIEMIERTGVRGEVISGALSVNKESFERCEQMADRNSTSAPHAAK